MSFLPPNRPAQNPHLFHRLMEFYVGDSSSELPSAIPEDLFDTRLVVAHIYNDTMTLVPFVLAADQLRTIVIPQPEFIQPDNPRDDYFTLMAFSDVRLALQAVKFDPLAQMEFMYIDQVMSLAMGLNAGISFTGPNGVKVLTPDRIKAYDFATVPQPAGKMLEFEDLADFGQHTLTDEEFERVMLVVANMHHSIFEGIMSCQLNGEQINLLGLKPKEGADIELFKEELSTVLRAINPNPKAKRIEVVGMSADLGPLEPLTRLSGPER